MFPIEPIGLGRGDKELTPIRVLARVGGRQHSRLTVLVLEILIGKGSSAVYAQFSRPVVIQKVTTLNHKTLNVA